MAFLGGNQLNSDFILLNMGKEFPHYKQLDQMDCGPTCLRMVAKYHGKHYTAQTLREKSQISREGVSMLGIAEAAESIGLKTVGVKVTLEMLIDEVPLPCILHWGQNHFVVLHKVAKSRIVGKDVLKAARGGRNPTVADTFVQEERMQFDTQPEKPVIPARKREAVFHIADPGGGLNVYNTSEFLRFWVAGTSHHNDEGLALLLEPTPRFYEEEGEAVKGLALGQLPDYLWHYKRLIFQLCLAMIIGSGLSLVFPFLTQSIVDIGIGTQDISLISLILIAQIVLMICSSAVDFLRSWVLLHISVRLNLTILSEFLAKLTRLPVSFFDVRQFGDIMQRIGDHKRIETFLTGQTLSILFSLFNLVVFSVILAFYHTTIFFVALAASLLYTVWVVIFLRQRRKLDMKRFGLAAGNQSQIIQLIQGMQDIKLAGAETSKRWEWERIQARLFKWSVKNLSLGQVQQAGSLLINQTKNVFITFLAAKAVIDGQLTLGGMMSVQYIISQFNTPVEQMILFLQSWQDAQISLERLNEVHQLEDEEPAHRETRKEWNQRQDISIQNLSYTYPGAGNEPVIRNFSLTIPYGKTTAIVGTSGSGKTTLLKLLLRFYDPQAGNIVLKEASRESTGDTGREKAGAEIALKSLSHKRWRQQCGVVMQEGFIFSDTIAGNIAVGKELIDQARLYHSARMANIYEFIESLPLGFHTKIGAEGNGISQGQKQRILIARAIYKDPAIMLFDEATNSLDANNEAVIISNLESFFKGRTVVVVAHRLSTVRHADQIVVMEKGEIVEIGRHHELIELGGKYFELVSNQLELAKG